MTRQRGVSLAIVLTGVSLAVGAIVLKWRDDRAFLNPALQLSRFPAEDASVLSIDFATLRRGGLLAPSKAVLEPEYKRFVEGTGFDYRRDLDHALASFSGSGNYFIARGRFDWDRLRTYARQQGGSCYRELCRMEGSTPQRHISFIALRPDTLALAVSSDDLAAARLTKTGEPITTPLPAAPVWLSLSGPALRQRGTLPPGVRLMLSALTAADRVVVSMAPASGRVEAHIDATCRTQDDAGVLASQLRITAGLVREGIAKSTVPKDDEFAQMLAAGTFDQTGNRVTGKWPVAKSLLESLMSGI
ncbi:MAG: hypothetical protein ABUS51_01725 [Acidobacteriota bacterium]